MSRPQVTITLGRSGQVVKKAGNALNNSRFDSKPLLGNKRSIRDRLGGSADTDTLYHASQPNLKRQRGGSDELCSYGAPDLRFKLIQKTKARQAQSITRKQSHADLQSMIWKSDNSPVSTCTMQCMPNPKVEVALTSKRIPRPRSADDLLHLESAGKSFLPWNHDGSRHRSPDKIIQGSMGVSLPRLNGQQQMPIYRPINTQGVSPFVGRNAYNHGGPQCSAPSVTRMVSSLEASRPFYTPHSQSSISQMGQEPLTVGNFLNSLGLGKYAVLFQAEEIDMAVLKQMQDNDLKEMGIPMGPRRKILLALLSRSRRYHIEL